jgi:hypothetical protein
MMINRILIDDTNFSRCLVIVESAYKAHPRLYSTDLIPVFQHHDTRNSRSRPSEDDQSLDWDGHIHRRVAGEIPVS